jgi:hypothetical protein
VVCAVIVLVADEVATAPPATVAVALYPSVPLMAHAVMLAALQETEAVLPLLTRSGVAVMYAVGERNVTVLEELEDSLADEHVRV